MTTNSTSRSWWAKMILRFRNHFSSFQASRLQAELGAYKVELEVRLPTFQDKAPISAAISMLAQAQSALVEGKVDQAWLMFDAARRQEVEFVDKKQIPLLAISLLKESQKLSSKWRREAIQEILKDPSNADISSVRNALEIRDGHLENSGFKMTNFSNQLSFLVVALAGLLGLIVILACKGAILEGLTPPQHIRLLVVICFGALGGTVSTMLSLSPKGIESRIPVQIITSKLAKARPILGAAAAVVVYIFWQMRIVNITGPSEIAYIAVSFVAGFSDRLLLNAIGKILGSTGNKEATVEGGETGDAEKEPKSGLPQENNKPKPTEKVATKTVGLEITAP